VAGPKTVLSHVHSSLQSLCDKQRQKEEKKQGTITVKHEVVTVYNRRMLEVGKMYQQLASFLILMRYCVKAYKVLLFYMLDMSFFNSYTLYKKIIYEFTLLVAEQLLETVTLPNGSTRGHSLQESEM